MKLNKFFTVIVFLFINNSFSQKATKIETINGIHYITTDIDLPLTVIYLFCNLKHTVEFNANVTEFYQPQEQSKRTMTLKFECKDTGK